VVSAAATGIRDASDGRRLALLAWLVLRLPLVLILIFVFRGALFDAIERTFDIGWTTELVIDVASTPVARVLLAAAGALAFWLIARAGARLQGGIGSYLASLAGACVAALAVLLATGSNPIWLAPIALPLATNWAPLVLFPRLGVKPKVLDALILALPGVGEGLFARRYAELAMGTAAQRSLGRGWPGQALMGALIAALLLGLLANGKGLVPLERAIRSGPDVRVVAEGNFNGIALDASGRGLFVTGYGVDNLLRFDAMDFSRPPIESDVATETAQGLAYDPATDEVLVYAADSKVVRVLDGASLRQKREIPVPGLSPGDSWIELDPRVGVVILASEADQQTGAPFLVIDRESGEVLDRSAEEPGNLFVSPAAPVLYMSYFRREPGIAAYDIAAHEITARYQTPARIDRMAYDAERDRLLAADPMGGRILALDPQTLEVTDRISALFGARVIAPTSDQDAVLVGSLATGKAALVSLGERRVLKTWYLGPWLRSIVVHPERPVAYVSANGTLYELRFDRD
jgi:DNA-binding beta-propeller fold protein YncE